MRPLGEDPSARYQHGHQRRRTDRQRTAAPRVDPQPQVCGRTAATAVVAPPARRFDAGHLPYEIGEVVPVASAVTRVAGSIQLIHVVQLIQVIEVWRRMGRPLAIAEEVRYPARDSALGAVRSDPQSKRHSPTLSPGAGRVRSPDPIVDSGQVVDGSKPESEVPPTNLEAPAPRPPGAPVDGGQ